MSHPEPAPSPTPNQPGVCHHRACTNPTHKRGWNGPPRLYCSNRCRQTEYRHRRLEADPGHAPPPQPSEAISPLNEAMAFIRQELPNLTERQMGSDYGQDLIRAHTFLARVVEQRLQK